MPDEDLMQAEWEKHGKIINLFILSNILRNCISGSCYYNTATEYFTAIEYLFNQLNIISLR
jgi:ribonuclease I